MIETIKTETNGTITDALVRITTEGKRTTWAVMWGRTGERTARKVEHFGGKKAAAAAFDKGW